MILRAFAVATISLFASTGCDDPGGRRGPAATPSTNGADAVSSSAEVVIHVDDDGKTFDTTRGSIVTFKLASHTGTGYVWIPMQVDPSILTQQGDRTSAIASDTPGAPKLDIFHFTAGAAGSTVVEMSLKRPFGSAAPARSIHVTVNVH
jgi:predicted secreted protein